MKAGDWKRFNIFTGIIYHDNWGNFSQGNDLDSPGKVFNDYDTHRLIGIGGGMELSPKVEIELSFWKNLDKEYGWILSSEFYPDTHK
jgi:hypothetical protein